MSKKNIFLSTLDLAKGKTLHGEAAKAAKKALEKGPLKLVTQKPMKGPGWIDMPSVPSALGKVAGKEKFRNLKTAGILFGLTKTAKEKQKLRRRVEAIVVDGKGRILAAKAPHGGVQFPGGGIDPGESVNQAANRETKEEMGYSLKNIRAMGFSPKSTLWGKALQKWMNEKGRNHTGSKTYYRIAQIKEKDMSIYGKDGDQVKGKFFERDKLQASLDKALRKTEEQNKFRPFAVADKVMLDDKKVQSVIESLKKDTKKRKAYAKQDLEKEAGFFSKTKSLLARASTWGVPLGKYTGPAPLGMLLGGGGYKRKMMVDNLVGKINTGNPLSAIEKNIVSHGMGVSPEKAEKFISTMAQKTKSGKVMKALTSEGISSVSGGMLGKSVPSYLATVGAIAPAAITAPVVAAGAGAGFLRNIANRRINRVALLDRLKSGSKLSLAETAAFDRLKNTRRVMQAQNIVRSGKRYGPVAAGTGVAGGVAYESGGN